MGSCEDDGPNQLCKLHNVENAIWHALMQKEAPGKVTMKVSKVDKRLRIVIEDDGVGRERA